MWLTPSGVPRYNLKPHQLVKINLKTGKAFGKLNPSIEWQMHQAVYKKLPHVNAIVHTHSPYTVGVSISSKFDHVIEESKVIVGDPVIINHYPSGSSQLAKLVSDSLSDENRAVIIKNHGVVAVGVGIDQARAVVESLEEWAKMLTISKIFGGPKNFLK